MRNRLILLLSAAALATAVMLVPSASAANCPAGQEGTPPYCKTTPTKPTPPPPATCAAGQVGTPPNCVTPTVDVGGVKIKPGSSSITLSINTPGTVKVSGKGIKTKTVSAAAGAVKLKVILTPQEKKILKKKGKVKITATITYTPTGGTPMTKKVTIVVQGKKPKK
jgi:hypothetical protein